MHDIVRHAIDCRVEGYSTLQSMAMLTSFPGFTWVLILRPKARKGQSTTAQVEPGNEATCMDTLGTIPSVLLIEVSLFQGS